MKLVLKEKTQEEYSKQDFSISPTKISIYGLVDPFTNQLRYIGQTKQNPYDRFSSHCCSTRNRGTKNENWIKSLALQKAKPNLLIIDTVDIKDWIFWEMFYIAYYKSIGCKLNNLTKGGDITNINKADKLKNRSLQHKGKKVILNDSKIFDSIKQCADFLNENAITVQQAIAKKRNLKGNIIQYYGNHKNEKIRLSNIQRPVIAIKNNIETRYNNAKEAAFVLNIDYSSICKCLKGKKSTVNKFEFKYEEYEMPKY